MDWGDIGGSSGFQIGYPILSALLSATGQRGANVAQGLNTGMAITNRYAQQRQQDEQNALLRQKLGDIFKSTENSPAATLPGATTNLGLASEERAGLEGLNNPPEATASTGNMGTMAPQPTEIAPATSKSIFTPAQQKLGEALAAANRPDLALGVAERAMSRTQQQPHTFGNAELGMFRLDENGQPVPLVPGVGRREPTPPRPVFGTQGGEGVSSIYNPETKQWETQRQRLTAAPAREISPEEQGLIKARTGAANAAAGNSSAQASAARARADRLSKLTQQGSDPKATAGQASAAMNALIRERDSIETPDEDKPVINDAIRAVRTRLAEIGRSPNGAQPAAQAQTPPGKPIGKTKDGKTVYQDENGKRYVAN